MWGWGAITKRHIPEERREQFGKAFEHFMLMEILAHRTYKELGYDVNFWRAKSGLEVDFVLGRGEVALGIKGASRIDNPDLRPLKALIQEYRPRKAFVFCNERYPRVHESIHIRPWRDFLNALWKGDVIS
jgi:predicted AAA+ superfamily ATPase